jgi:hypothetical protein
VLLQKNGGEAISWEAQGYLINYSTFAEYWNVNTDPNGSGDRTPVCLGDK